LDTALNYCFFGVASEEEEEEKTLCADTVRPLKRRIKRNRDLLLLHLLQLELGRAQK
jgi:hypothetical protein